MMKFFGKSFLQSILLIIFFTTSILAAGPKDLTKKKRLEISLGIDRTITLDYVPDARAQIGNESIVKVDFIPAKKQIIVGGLKVGKSSVVIRNTVGEVKDTYIVNVTKNSHSEEIRTLKDALGDIEGLEIGIKGDRVYVGGNIVVPNDIGKVAIILEKHPDVMRLYEFDPQTQRIIAEKMQKEIGNQGLKNVRVRVLNGVFLLEGQVTSGDEKNKAEDVLRIFLPDKIDTLSVRTDSARAAPKPIFQNFISVNPKNKPNPLPKLLKITAQFVELSKDYKKIFAFKWQPLLAGGGGSIGIGQRSNGSVGTTSNNSLAATISNLFPKLASAKGAGYARIIQAGTIVMKDKTKGKLVKSETTPFALGTKDFTKATSATAGFNLEVTPTVLEKENVQLKIGLKVNATSAAGNGAQGNNAQKTLSNEVSTNLIVKSKESAVVGGIVINKTNTNYDKDPPGGASTAADPTAAPLFNFVRSKSYTATRSQFVVFVTPVIIDSASQGTEKIKQKFRKRGR